MIGVVIIISLSFMLLLLLFFFMSLSMFFDSSFSVIIIASIYTIVFELTHSKTIVENSLKIKSQPAVFENLS